MISRILHTALIFSLMLSVLTINTCHGFCTILKDKQVHNCCSKKQSESVPDCCKVSEANAQFEHNEIKASSPMPFFLLIGEIAFNYHFSLSELSKEYSSFLYRPPLITRDISVLFRVFRL